MAIAMTPYRSCAPPSTSCPEGRLLAWGVPATGVLVETLLERGADGDVVEAEAAIERLAAAPRPTRTGVARHLAAADAGAAGARARR